MALPAFFGKQRLHAADAPLEFRASGSHGALTPALRPPRGPTTKRRVGGSSSRFFHGSTV
eukprot:3834222-Prorocentrum_lima.AAC.1